MCISILQANVAEHKVMLKNMRDYYIKKLNIVSGKLEKYALMEKSLYDSWVICTLLNFLTDSS